MGEKTRNWEECGAYWENTLQIGRLPPKLGGLTGLEICFIYAVLVNCQNIHKYDFRAISCYVDWCVQYVHMFIMRKHVVTCSIVVASG